MFKMQSWQEIHADSVEVILSQLENLGSEDELAPVLTFISSPA